MTLAALPPWVDPVASYMWHQGVPATLHIAAAARRPARQHHPELDDRVADRRDRAARHRPARSRAAHLRHREPARVRDLRRSAGCVLRRVVPADEARRVPREAPGLKSRIASRVALLTREY